MKMIEVLQKVANGEIKEGTKIILNDDLFIFNGGVFGSGLYYLENCMFLKKEDLNQEVELIPPKEKKYRVRFELLGSSKKGSFLSLEKCPYGVFLSIQEGTGDIKTQFTKSEMQSIKPVREFLEDMEGKFELIEVEENEGDNRHGN